MMLIDDIISLDTNINSWYRESRLPKLIRKRVAQNRRKKLINITYKYKGLVLEYNDIMSFLTVCLRVNPPDGAYMYIKKIVEYITKGETHYAVSMSVTIENPDGITIVTYTIDMVNDAEQIMNIKVSMDSPRGRTSAHANRTSLEVQEGGDPVAEKLIDNCNDMFIHMIIQLLLDVFKRSERIYEE